MARASAAAASRPTPDLAPRPGRGPARVSRRPRCRCRRPAGAVPLGRAALAGAIVGDVGVGPLIDADEGHAGRRGRRASRPGAGSARGGSRTPGTGRADRRRRGGVVGCGDQPGVAHGPGWARRPAPPGRVVAADEGGGDPDQRLARHRLEGRALRRRLEGRALRRRHARRSWRARPRHGRSRRCRRSRGQAAPAPRRRGGPPRGRSARGRDRRP